MVSTAPPLAQLGGEMGPSTPGRQEPPQVPIAQGLVLDLSPLVTGPKVLWPEPEVGGHGAARV